MEEEETKKAEWKPGSLLEAKEPAPNEIDPNKFLNPFAQPEVVDPDSQKNSGASADRAEAADSDNQKSPADSVDKQVAESDNQKSPADSVDKQVADPASEKKKYGDSADRGIVLANVEKEKGLALIKAWEENEKTKVDNKAYKRLSAVGTWENSKKAEVEVQRRKYEEKLEKKKAEYEERMKNKLAEIHKEAEEKRATIEARRGEDVLKVEETAAKFRAAGFIQRKFLSCLS